MQSYNQHRQHSACSLPLAGTGSKSSITKRLDNWLLRLSHEVEFQSSEAPAGTGPCQPSAQWLLDRSMTAARFIIVNHETFGPFLTIAGVAYQSVPHFVLQGAGYVGLLTRQRPCRCVHGGNRNQKADKALFQHNAGPCSTFPPSFRVIPKQSAQTWSFRAVRTVCT
jgi:hypothetical protein